MSDNIKIAAVQTDPKLMQVKENLDNTVKATREAAKNKANLVVFLHWKFLIEIILSIINDSY